MKLSELEPQFLKVVDDHTFKCVEDINEADGIMFLCPVCIKGDSHHHSINCWQPHVPQTVHPIPGRWNFLGNDYNDLTLKNGSSSILINGGCKAHFWITNGEIIF